MDDSNADRLAELVACMRDVGRKLSRTMNEVRKGGQSLSQCTDARSKFQTLQCSRFQDSDLKRMEDNILTDPDPCVQFMKWRDLLWQTSLDYVPRLDSLSRKSILLLKRETLEDFLGVGDGESERPLLHIEHRFLQFLLSPLGKGNQAENCKDAVDWAATELKKVKHEQDVCSMMRWLDNCELKKLERQILDSTSECYDLYWRWRSIAWNPEINDAIEADHTPTVAVPTSTQEKWSTLISGEERYAEAKSIVDRSIGIRAEAIMNLLQSSPERLILKLELSFLRAQLIQSYEGMCQISAATESWLNARSRSSRALHFESIFIKKTEHLKGDPIMLLRDSAVTRSWFTSNIQRHQRSWLKEELSQRLEIRELRDIESKILDERNCYNLYMQWRRIIWAPAAQTSNDFTEIHYGRMTDKEQLTLIKPFLSNHRPVLRLEKDFLEAMSSGMVQESERKRWVNAEICRMRKRLLPTDYEQVNKHLEQLRKRRPVLRSILPPDISAPGLIDMAKMPLTCFVDKKGRAASYFEVARAAISSINRVISIDYLVIKGELGKTGLPSIIVYHQKNGDTITFALYQEKDPSAMCVGTALALQKLHSSHKFHGDVQMSNCVSSVMNGGIIDLTYSEDVDREQISPRWIPPEWEDRPQHYISSAYLDEWQTADVYALGATFIELHLEGYGTQSPDLVTAALEYITMEKTRHPPEGQLASKQDLEFVDVVKQCLCRSPAARPSASVVCTMLKKIYNVIVLVEKLKKAASRLSRALPFWHSSAVTI